MPVIFLTHLFQLHFWQLHFRNFNTLILPSKLCLSLSLICYFYSFVFFHYYFGILVISMKG